MCRALFGPAAAARVFSSAGCDKQRRRPCTSPAATNQIKDFAAFAKQSGREFILVVRKDTVLTKELERMAADGLVHIQRR
jgi:hypothetical protein